MTLECVVLQRTSLLPNLFLEGMEQIWRAENMPEVLNNTVRYSCLC